MWIIISAQCPSTIVQKLHSMNVNISFWFPSLLWSGWPLPLFLSDTLSTLWLFSDYNTGITQTSEPLLPSLKMKIKISCCFLQCFKAICKLKVSGECNRLLAQQGWWQGVEQLGPVRACPLTETFTWGEAAGASSLPGFPGGWGSFSLLAAPSVPFDALWVCVTMGRYGHI